MTPIELTRDLRSRLSSWPLLDVCQNFPSLSLASATSTSPPRSPPAPDHVRLRHPSSSLRPRFPLRPPTGGPSRLQSPAELMD